jgi:hypothetical protein
MLFDGQPVEEAAARLRAVVDGYQADDTLRAELPATIVRRTEAMLNLLESAHGAGFQPWADMYVNGHGEHWRGAAQYVRQHQSAWEQALYR